MVLNILWIVWTKGTGKDYFYETIKDVYSDKYNILRISFWDQLKKYYIKHNKTRIGKEAEKFLKPLGKKYILETEKDYYDAINILKNIKESTVRSDLQTLWIEKKKTNGPDFWIKQAYNELWEKINDTDESKDTFVFITDVRFIDEALFILSTWGFIVTFKNYKMLTENIKKLNSGDTTINHISEKLWYLPVDLWITYSLTGDIEKEEFYKFPNKWMLLSIMEDIRYLIENRKKYSPDEYKNILDEWYNYFNKIEWLSDKKIKQDFSEFVIQINNLFKKDIGIIS